MKREQLPIYALALAVLIVGLAAVGVPVTSLLPALAVLACPLMMIFMMRGMHGHQHQDRGRDHEEPLAGQASAAPGTGDEGGDRR